MVEQKRANRMTCKRIRALRKEHERLSRRYWKGDDEYGVVFYVRDIMNEELAELVPARERRAR